MNDDDDRDLIPGGELVFALCAGILVWGLLWAWWTS